MIKSDIAIAQKANLQPIDKIADKIGIKSDDLEMYGRYQAKVSGDLLEKVDSQENGDLVLVTAMTPTPAGEGKTTTTIGLGQALWRMGKKAIVCLREPSLGPCFGIKGGAAGGGYSQVLPMEEINLHFTGDIHAVGAANNLLAAMIDNHIYHGNPLGIDPEQIYWRRCVDISDRALRSIANGYDITAASEVMAILCLSTDLNDLRIRLGRIVVAAGFDHQPITVKDLKAAGAMTVLLKEAIKPNLVQTIEGTPALIHGGPFANIAHGCSSLMATRLALKLGRIVVTEAGFGADLGAEKFFDIKCRIGNLKPKAVVLMATIRALNCHGQGNLQTGFENLGKQIENIQLFGLPLVVAINRFSQDSQSEIDSTKDYCRGKGVEAIVSDVWAKGGKGGINLAGEVLKLLRKDSQKDNHFHFLYQPKSGVKKIVQTIVAKVYGGQGVIWEEKAEAALDRYQKWGIKNLPVCIAKTPLSLSDDSKLLGRPKGFKVRIRDLRLSAGAGFFIPIAGNIMTMPGLPSQPAAEQIDVDQNGKTIGLF